MLVTVPGSVDAASLHAPAPVLHMSAPCTGAWEPLPAFKLVWRDVRSVLVFLAIRLAHAPE